MAYRFVTDREDYSDYASGKVFYNAPGHPAFPVRLVSEIFQRCMAIRQAHGQTNPVSLYDPCCGAAYHLAVLGVLHRDQIDTLIGSDVDENILAVAARNLSLLTEQGLEKRKEEIEGMVFRFGKEAHVTALETVGRFQQYLQQRATHQVIKTHLFQADVTQAQEIGPNLPAQPVDIVFSDIPYNQHSAWEFSEPLPFPSQSPVWHLLESLMPFLSDDSIVVIAADKGQKVIHEAYQRIDRFQVGKRQMVFLRPLSSANRSLNP